MEVLALANCVWLFSLGSFVKRQFDDFSIMRFATDVDCYFRSYLRIRRVDVSHRNRFLQRWRKCSRSDRSNRSLSIHDLCPFPGDSLRSCFLESISAFVICSLTPGVSSVWSSSFSFFCWILRICFYWISLMICFYLTSWKICFLNFWMTYS